MFMNYSPLYRPSSTSTFKKSKSKSSDINQPEWFTRILEDFYNKILLAVKYTCCIPVPKKVCRTHRSRQISKKRILFNIPRISSVASIEEEIPSPLAFDCLEVPETPIVDPYLGCPSRVRNKKNKIKMLFKKSKSRRNNEESDGEEEVKVENKCTGECVPIDGTISIMDSLASTTATAGDNVNVAGDGPQVARTGRKRVSDFFNEIYNTWNGVQ